MADPSRLPAIVGERPDGAKPILAAFATPAAQALTAPGRLRPPLFH
jgi:hypothetical protein